MIPSHYHDDHLAGLPWLQQTQGTKAWIFENFAEIVLEPAGYNIPCLLAHPIRVDRALPDGGRVSWDRWTFDVFHMPGHTWWALGLFGEIDGTRVAFTGDNLLAGDREPAPGRRARSTGTRCSSDSIAVGVRRLMEFEPELLLTGHTGALEVTGRCSRTSSAGRARLEGVFRTLVAVPAEVNFALDPNFAILFPYQNPARPGDRLPIELRVTNHGAADATARASLVAPPGWSVSPGEATTAIAPGDERHAPVRGRGAVGCGRPSRPLRRALTGRAALRPDRGGAGRRGVSGLPGTTPDREEGTDKREDGVAWHTGC